MAINVALSFLQGKLTDGTVFDSSFERGDPIEFELGSGQVIPGVLQLHRSNSIFFSPFLLLFFHRWTKLKVMQ